MNLMDYIALDEERSKMNRVYKFNIGDVFTIDAKTWEKQFGRLDFPNNYVEIGNKDVLLRLEGIEKIKTKRHWWQFWKLKKKCYRFRVIAVA